MGYVEIARLVLLLLQLIVSIRNSKQEGKDVDVSTVIESVSTRLAIPELKELAPELKELVAVISELRKAK